MNLTDLHRRLLRDVLAERGWRDGEDLSYREFVGAGHNENAWGARFGEVLRWMWREPSLTGGPLPPTGQ